jgi:TRAP-type C4-dicarboxylate transport system permease small subunit
MGTLRKSPCTIYGFLDYMGEVPGFIAILAMLVTVITGVIARYVFNSPLHFVDEYNGYFNVVAIFLPLAWVAKHSSHINIDFVVKAIPTKTAQFLGIVTAIISLIVVVVLLLGTIELVRDSFASDRRSWGILSTPLGPWQLALPMGFGLFSVQLVIDIVKKIGEIVIKQEGGKK